ncbi:MAG: 5-(carboxyamino)imidazole ribonucleotide synthase [Woeseiaceae bacterium]
MTTVGVIGAGQLGQMLGFAGRSLDLHFIFLDPALDPPARLAGQVINEPFDSEKGLELLAARADVVTYEFENVPVMALEALAKKVPVLPAAAALHYAQDRLREKQLFETLNIPIPAYCAVDSEDDLREAIRTLGQPLVLKTRRFGYDGKGQRVIRSESDANSAWVQLGGKPLIAEQWVAFEREVSIIGARNRAGETALYPLVENRHRQGILEVSKAPANADNADSTAAEYLLELLVRLDYVGVLALELFAEGGRLLANEFAPRVHNSAHWTLEGAITSQFENHLRAILGLPLGDTGATGHAGMINLTGTLPADQDALRRYGFTVHDYGKVPRSGRKLGHITTVADTAAERDRRLSQALKILGNMSNT